MTTTEIKPPAAARADVEDTGERDEKGRRLVRYRGVLARELANGTLQDAKTTAFLTPPAREFAPEPLRTSQQAIAMNWTRWHKPRQDAAIAAVRTALERDDIDSIDTADAAMLSAMITEVVLNAKVRADHRVRAWIAVLEQSGMDARAPRGENSTQELANASAIGAGTAAGLLMAALAELQKRQQQAASDE